MWTPLQPLLLSFQEHRKSCRINLGKGVRFTRILLEKGSCSMLRKRTSDKDPADWFAFAAERVHSADVLREHEGLTASGIESLQEGVERYLKGYLIAKGWRLIKTHDLTLLVRAAKAFDHAFNAFIPMAEELTEDFFAQHYPGEDMTLVGENYDELRKKAEELIGIIRQSLTQFFPTRS